MQSGNKKWRIIAGIVIIMGLLLIVVVIQHYKSLHTIDSSKILSIEKNTDYNEEDIRLDLITKEGQTSEPYYLSSLIVGEMMNLDTIKQVNKFRGSKDPLGKLDNWELWHFNHREEVKPHPYENSARIFSYDTMKQSAHYYGGSVAQCYDFAIYNTAMLRLLGVSSKECYTLLSPTHGYILFNYDGVDYAYSNNLIHKYQKNGIFLSLADRSYNVNFKDKMFNDIVLIANDAYYIPSNKEESNYKHEYLQKYNAYLTYTFDPESATIIDKNVLNFIGNKKLKPTKVLSAIYSLSQKNPNSQYTQGKYEAQSLLVKYPNLYLKAFSKQPMIKKVIEENNLDSKENVFFYLNDHIAVDEKCHDRSKFYSPFELEIGSNGTVVDRAIYASVLLNDLKINNSVVITDKTAYVYLDDSEQWIQADSFEEVKSYKGKILMSFNKESVYYPELEMYTYHENSKLMEAINEK